MIENNNESRFLYNVFPKKPIKNLNESISLLRVPKALQLNKEEVSKCLDCGSVYRWFSNEGINEKIAKSDIDRVHRANYISKEDWKLIQLNADKVENLTVNGTDKPKKETTVDKVIEVKEEVKNTSTVDPEPVVETKDEGYIANEILNEDKVENETVEDEVEKTNDSTEETEENDEIIEDTTIEDEDIEDVDDDSETEDIESVESNKNTNVVVNYHNNGKKKKHH